ncbi:MAG: hypothetical protein ACLFUH_02500 [Bacteroidales bacterium]
MDIQSAIKLNQNLLKEIFSKDKKLHDIKEELRKETGLQSGNRENLTIGVGHQPVTYYPGLLLKNFFAGSQAKRLNINAINFIVDSDNGPLDVPVPFFKNGYYGKEIIQLKKNPEIIFQNYNLSVPEVENFFHRTRDNLQTLNNQEVIQAFEEWENKFWVIYNKENNFPEALSYMRNDFEKGRGIKFHDIKISSIAGTNAYYRFIWYIIEHLNDFCKIYNDAVLNQSSEKYSPVKCLYSEKGWTEIPFWMIKEGKRYRVEIKKNINYLEVRSKEAGNQFSIDITSNAVEELKNTILLYPKATTLTIMFRLFFCDLFVHGFGAVEYEKVNNEFMKKFFNLKTSPLFYAVTGDIYFPFFSDMPDYNEAEKEKKEKEKWLKEFQHNPANLLNRETSLKFKQKKMHIVKAMRKEENKKKKKDYHQMLKMIDSQIKNSLSPEKEDVQKNLNGIQFFLENQKIFFERKYPYFIYPRNVLAYDNLEKNMIIKSFK